MVKKTNACEPVEASRNMSRVWAKWTVTDGGVWAAWRDGWATACD